MKEIKIYNTLKVVAASDETEFLVDAMSYADVACQAKRKKVTRKTQKTALIYPIYGNQSGFSYVI